MVDTVREHAKLVARTCKPGSKIIMTIDQSHLVHMALGIASEAGELVDAVKEHAIYNTSLDIKNIIEELGDLEWYMEGMRARLGLTREEILCYNIDKLNRRYPNLYSDKDAQQRADKSGPMYTTQDGPEDRNDRLRK